MKCHRLFVLALSMLAATIACERRPGAGGSATSTGDILVGMYGSLTGDGASFGQSSVEGAQLAVEELNNAGGLLGGRKIKLLVEDDQSKPDEASNAVQKLITQNKVIAVLGEVASRRSCSRSTDILLPSGAANRNLLRPNPSGSTSMACARESSSMSLPVMPTSRVPSPT